MNSWLEQFKFDPISPLLNAGDPALEYFTRRDLLGEALPPIEGLWKLPEASRILRKQLPDGSWPRPGDKKFPAVNYNLIETWRQLRYLVEKYGMTRQHPQVERAVEFVFSCQSPQGDLRGILANQYATYYTGAILSLLIQAGCVDDPRIEKGFDWLLVMRQEDGGWTIPLLTHKLDRAAIYRLTSEYTEPLEPDRTRPFSHNWTGMVLRAFAAHPRCRHSDAAWTAGKLLKSRFFQPDSYTSYQSAGYWLRFEFPFWWNNLLTSLDSLSRIGFTREDEQIQCGLQWFIEHQQDSGLWKDTYTKETKISLHRILERGLWVSLAVCRVFRMLS
ncbi:MAG: hypothetical protein A2Z16_03010 [Chloroflexi bacterium RBG_16_54_18]|nr:MAG: hypothetical protein A2Z16_03010 [Chloroflexi bacterium RBG_16_54_18]